MIDQRFLEIVLSRRRALAGLGASLGAGFSLLSQPRAGWAAEPAAPGAATASVVEVAPGVFVHTGEHALQTSHNAGDISNSGFVVGDAAVAVIDTGGSYRAGRRLRAAIEQATEKPVRFVVNTHMHPDHVLGNAAFEGDGVEFVAHHKMARALAARGERYLEAAETAMGAEAFEGTRIVLPTTGIETATEIDLGGRELRLEAKPTAHTDNDLVVTDLETGTAFVGDLVFSGHVPALDGSIKGWLEVLEEMGSPPPERIVPGHGPAAMTWPDAAEPMRRYLTAVARDVRKVIAEGGTIGEAMRSAGADERGRWELFDEFHARNVSAAFAELEWE